MFQRDPRYGNIPLVRNTWTDAAGNEHHGLQYDLDYAPPLPKGAVKGDVRRQEFCLICPVTRRSGIALRQTLVAARAQAESRPSDAGAQLALAEAIIRYVQRHEEGPLNGAIAARAAHASTEV